MRNAFSVDVEDWYQVSDFEEVVDFSAWDHYESRVARNTDRVLEILDDIMRSKKILEDLTGQPVWGYRAPSFSITARSEWALDILLECGMRYDSSIFPVNDRLYGIPNAQRFPFVIRSDGDRSLVEFPMTTARAARRNWPLGGGAYLRLFPYA